MPALYDVISLCFYFIFTTKKQWNHSMQSGKLEYFSSKSSLYVFFTKVGERLWNLISCDWAFGAEYYWLPETCRNASFWRVLEENQRVFYVLSLLGEVMFTNNLEIPALHGVICIEENTEKHTLFMLCTTENSKLNIIYSWYSWD